MAMLRTTILIDEWVAGMVRQQFNGNLSRGINSLLQAHFQEKKPKMEGFGMFKDEGLLKEWKKMHKEDKLKEEKKLARLVRG